MCDCAGGLLLLTFLGFLGLIIICTGLDRIEGRVYSIQKEAECLKKKVDDLSNALELNKAEAKEKKVEEVIVVELDKENRVRIEGGTGKVIVEDKHALDSGEGGGEGGGEVQPAEDQLSEGEAPLHQWQEELN